MIDILIRILIYDGFYLSILYFICLFLRENVIDKMNSFISISERYFYYIILSFINWNINVLFWTKIDLSVLSFPYFVIRVVNTTLFKTYYTRSYNWLCEHIRVTICDVISGFLNFVISQIVNIEQRVQSYEIQAVYDNFESKKVINMLQIILVGVIYDYLYKYYKILLFQRVNSVVLQRYKDELQTMVVDKNFKGILTPKGISKIVILYYHTDHSWLYEKFHMLWRKFQLEFIRVNSYWSLVCFINLWLNGYTSLLLTYGVYICFEKELKLEVKQTLIQFLLLYLLSSQFFTSVLLILYLPRIVYSYISERLKSIRQSIDGYSLIPTFIFGIFSKYSILHLGSLCLFYVLYHQLYLYFSYTPNINSGVSEDYFRNTIDPMGLDFVELFKKP